MLRSTASRLALFYSLAFALVTLTLIVTIYWAMRGELRHELDQRVLSERANMLRYAATSGLLGVVASRAQHSGGDVYFAVVDKDGRIVAGTPLAQLPALGWNDVSFRESKGGYDDARAFASALPNNRILVVGVDPESVERLDHRMILLLGAAFAAITVVGVAGGFVLSALLRRRVKTIGGAAEAIIGGDLTQRMPLSGADDEFDRLSATLNTMLDRITALMTNLRQVSGDIAHDLRTPLSRLRQKLELSLVGANSPEAISAAVHDAIDQSDEILALFTAILSISEVEAGALPLEGKQLDLSALVTDIADSYLPAAEDGGRTIVRRIEAGLTIEGSRELIAQLMVNLLDNALRHTPEGSAITVTLLHNGDHARLTVADNGPGIPAEERQRVFERFARLERSRSTAGHGLGLSLVAAIAAAHRAPLTLEDNKPGVKIMVDFERCAP